MRAAAVTPASMSVTASASGCGMPNSSMIFSKQPRSSAFLIACVSVPMMGTPNSRQRLGQVDGRLSAERHDDRLRFFEVDDVHHVLDRQRFEIELVAGSVVRRHGFGVVVDDDRLVAGLADRPDGMHGRVVELNALADTDRARAEHHDLLACRSQPTRSPPRKSSRNRAHRS